MPSSAPFALALFTGIAPSGVIGPPADDPEGIVAAFEEWAMDNGTPVEMAACSAPNFDRGEGIAVCFGTAGGQIVTAFLTFNLDDELVAMAGYATGGLGALADMPAGTPPDDGYPPSFPDGTWVVNEQIAPDTYVTTTAGQNCDWEQTPADPDAAVTGHATPDGQWTVTILPSDREFWSEDCGLWVRAG